MNSFTEDDFKRLTEQIKINKANKYTKNAGYQPLNILKHTKDDGDNEKSSPEHQNLTSDLNRTNKHDIGKDQWQNAFSQLTNEKQALLAELARKDKHIIYKFKDDEPPKLGEKPSNDDKIPIDVYYKEIRNSRHVEFEKLRARVYDLTNIKNSKMSSTDENGDTIPPIYTKNDIEKTGIDDKTFNHINEAIVDAQLELYQQMAYWFYGIDKELYGQLENNSLTLAVEAGQYREMFGLVNSSKNSESYLK